MRNNTLPNGAIVAFLDTRNDELKLRLQWELGTLMRQMTTVVMQLDNLGGTANESRAEALGGISKAELNDRIALLKDADAPLTVEAILSLGNAY